VTVKEDVKTLQRKWRYLKEAILACDEMRQALGTVL
jgi:hypothetical protein